MTEPEFEVFFNASLAAFPGLGEWLQRNSPDVPRTVASWRKTLERVTAEEANKVLDGWIDGSIKNPPVGFRREVFAQEVRSLVATWRDESLRESQREEQFRKSHVGRYTRPKGIVEIAPYLNRVIELGEDMRNGKIAAEECAALIDEVVAEGCRAIDAKGLVPCE